VETYALRTRVYTTNGSEIQLVASVGARFLNQGENVAYRGWLVNRRRSTSQQSE